MRMFQRHMVAICHLLAFISCSATDIRKPIVFPKTVVLEGRERTIMDDVHLKYPFRVRLDENTLYVMDIHPAEYYCHTFVYPSMQHKHSFMKRGGAADEFLDAENIRIDQQGKLWGLDANKKKMVDLGRQGAISPKREIDLDTKLIRTLDFDLVNDSTFVVPDYTGQHRISFVNNNGEAVKHLFHIPVSPSSLEQDMPVVLAQAWRSFLSFNRGNGILGVVTQLGQVLELYDLKQDTVIKIVYKDGMEPQFVSRGNYAVPNGIMGYSDVFVGQEYVYAIFWGHSFEDIRQQKQDKEGGRYIHVFDLKGNPVRQYVLDRYITGFHVDEANKKFITLDVNSNQPIVEYIFEN